METERGSSAVEPELSLPVTVTVTGVPGVVVPRSSTAVGGAPTVTVTVERAVPPSTSLTT